MKSKNLSWLNTATRLLRRVQQTHLSLRSWPKILNGNGCLIYRVQTKTYSHVNTVNVTDFIREHIRGRSVCWIGVELAWNVDARVRLFLKLGTTETCYANEYGDSFWKMWRSINAFRSIRDMRTNRISRFLLWIFHFKIEHCTDSRRDLYQF